MLITADGQAKISDFGLARAAELDSAEQTSEQGRAESLGRAEAVPTLSDETGESLTRTGTILGTPAYMAPEQHLGEPADARSDQYSFCVALFEALYGRRPFRGETLEQLRLRVLSGDLRDPSAGTSVPRWIFPVLARGLKVEPTSRWPSVVALLSALAKDPLRARRRWLFGAGALLALAAGLVGMQRWSAATLESSMRACRAPELELAERWQRERPEVLARIEGSGAPGATQAAKHISAVLDEFVTRWSGAYSDSCGAAVDAGTLPDDLLTLRTSCLQRQRGSAEAVIELYKDADPALILRSSQLLSSLPTPERCLDLRVISRAIYEAPRDTAKRVEAMTLQRQLARVSAELAAGRYETALGRFDALLAEIRAFGDRAMLAEASLLHGRALADFGDMKQAERAYLESFRDAAAVDAEHLAAESISHLVYHFGYYASDLEEAERWSVLAEGLLDRVDDDSLRLRFFNYYAALKSQAGQHAEALVLYDRSIELSKNVDLLRHDEATMANNRGVCLNFLGRRDEAREAHERALSLIIADFSDDHPDTALTRNSLGVVLLYQGHLLEAASQFERALEIQERSLGASHPLLALTLINLSGVHTELGEFTRAQSEARRALSVLRSTGIGENHLFAGYAELALGDARARTELALGREHYERAAKLLEANLGAEHYLVSLPLVGLAELALAEGELERAAELLNRADGLQAGCTALGEAEPARRKATKARLLAAQEDREGARALALEAEASFGELGPHYAARRAAIAAWRDEALGEPG